MDDDKEKSAIEKMVDKVNDAVENIVNTASAAAMKAMEPEPDPEQVAGTTNEQVYIPERPTRRLCLLRYLPPPLRRSERCRRRRPQPHPKNRRRNPRKRKQLRRPPQKHRRRLRKSPERKKQNHQRDVRLPQKRRRSVHDDGVVIGARVTCEALSKTVKLSKLRKYNLQQMHILTFRVTGSSSRNNGEVHDAHGTE
jgi:hypothetical protein